MNPKLIFLLMVVIIIALWWLQKILANKSENFSQLEREYIEGIKKFKNQEITKEQLVSASRSFFSVAGISESDFDENLERDLEIYGK